MAQDRNGEAGYNTARAVNSLAAHRAEAIRAAREKTLLLYELDPAIAQTDDAISQTAYALYLAGGSEEAAEKVKSECELHKQKRAAQLAALGYAPDFDAPIFNCDKCNDTGYIKLEKCQCLKAEEAHTAMARTNLGKGLDASTFESFDLSLCTDSAMKGVLKACRDYAEAFSMSSENLLMYGGTGLGKTHLAAAIAHIAASKGYYIVYESAQRIVFDCRKAAFSDGTDSDSKYFRCDLLIIDDLGTEARTEFSIAAVSEIINKRLVGGLPTIISTNLDPGKLNELYGSRIASRVFGTFVLVHFVGKDVRMMKIKQSMK